MKPIELARLLVGTAALSLSVVPVVATGAPVPLQVKPTEGQRPPTATVTLNFDFAQSAMGWTANYVDYPPEVESQIDFQSGVRPVPGLNRSGYLLGGTNRSDDLSMYMIRLADKLAPFTDYRVNARVTIATNAGADCFGVGGGPGSSVYFKAGASAVQPRKVRDAEGWYRVSLDKGNQAESGREAVTIGNIGGTGTGTCDAPKYGLKTLSSGSDAPVVRSDSRGQLWLFLATDSAFEARTEVYVLSAQFRLVPVAR